MRTMMRKSVVLLHCCYSWMMVPCSGKSSLRTESRKNIQDIIKTKLPTINEDSTELCFSAAPAASSLQDHHNHHKSENHRKRQQGQGQEMLQHQVEMMIMRTSSGNSSTGAATTAAANTNKGIKSGTSTTGGGRPQQPRRPFSLTDYYVHFILKFASRAARF